MTTQYRYTRDSVESVYADGEYQLTPAWMVGGLYEKNIRSGQRLQAGVRVGYRSQCWGITVAYLNEPSDNTIAFTIELIGLGEVGTSY